MTSFPDFVAARGTSLLRLAYLTCGSRDDAEDVLQHALERAYRSWHRIDGEPEAYVRRIVVNTAISRARRRAILAVIPSATVPDTPAASPFGGLELRLVLADRVRALPPRQRAVLVLRFWEDLSEAQAAEVLGCSVGTVKSQCAKALTRLRALVGADELEIRDA